MWRALNLQIHNPRNDDGQDAMRLCDAWQRRGCLPMMQGRPTRRAGRQSAEFDYDIASNDVAWTWGVAIKWTTESDHAWLSTMLCPDKGGLLTMRRCYWA